MHPEKRYSTTLTPLHPLLFELSPVEREGREGEGGREERREGGGEGEEGGGRKAEGRRGRSKLLIAGNESVYLPPHGGRTLSSCLKGVLPHC